MVPLVFQNDRHSSRHCDDEIGNELPNDYMLKPACYIELVILTLAYEIAFISSFPSYFCLKFDLKKKKKNQKFLLFPIYLFHSTKVRKV